MGTKEHKALVRALVDAQNAYWAGEVRDYDRRAFFTEDRVYHTETSDWATPTSRHAASSREIHDVWQKGHHETRQLTGDARTFSMAARGGGER